MKPKEFRKYVLLKGSIPFPLTNETGIAYDSIYDEKSLLLYDQNTNFIAFTKFDSNTNEIIVNNETTVFRIEAVKDKQTFLNYINSLNAYCIEHNCDYKTALNKEAIPESNKDDVVCVQSPTDPNQQIIYCKTNKSIRFLEVYEGSSITDIEFKCEEKPNSPINENNFAEFAKESFKFCKENECFFADYANEIAPDILESICSTNETVNENSKAELSNADRIKQGFRRYKEQKELEKLTGATGEFGNHGQEKQ